jgi:hypothetical protein
MKKFAHRGSETCKGCLSGLRIFCRWNKGYIRGILREGSSRTCEFLLSEGCGQKLKIFATQLLTRPFSCLKHEGWLHVHNRTIIFCGREQIQDMLTFTSSHRMLRFPLLITQSVDSSVEVSCRRKPLYSEYEVTSRSPKIAKLARKG